MPVHERSNSQEAQVLARRSTEAAWRWQSCALRRRWFKTKRQERNRQMARSEKVQPRIPILQQIRRYDHIPRRKTFVGSTNEAIQNPPNATNKRSSKTCATSTTSKKEQSRTARASTSEETEDKNTTRPSRTNSHITKKKKIHSHVLMLYTPIKYEDSV